MSEPGSPQLDWDGIFDRAHRRVLIRLLLLGALGALGGLLLLGGGLSARGAIKWRLGPLASSKASVAKLSKLTLSPSAEEELNPPPPAPPPHRGPRHKKSHIHVSPPIPIPTPTPTPLPPCPETDSGGIQYNECLPEPTGPTGPTGPEEPQPTENGGTEAPPEDAGTAPEPEPSPEPASPAKPGLAPSAQPVAKG